jgi:beta-lactam-binding protein with PASTA domain
MNKFFLYLKTDVFRKNLIIAVSSILAFLIIIFFLLRVYTRHGESLAVPELKGMRVENAIELLKSKGLDYQIDSVYQIDKTPGTVILQDPDPNTNVKTNRTIYLTIITSQTPNVGLPDIVEKTFLEVQAILNSSGLKVGDTIYRSDIARDRVLDVLFAGQSIRKGEPIPKGSRVNLVLGDGRGSSQIDLPDLTGLTLSEATFVLRNGASLNLGMVSYQGGVKDSANAVIIRQFPALSDSVTKVSIGSTIDVVLSDEKR